MQTAKLLLNYIDYSGSDHKRKFDEAPFLARRTSGENIDSTMRLDAWVPDQHPEPFKFPSDPALSPKIRRS